jgi:hypothetical protein
LPLLLLWVEFPPMLVIVRRIQRGLMVPRDQDLAWVGESFKPAEEGVHFGRLTRHGEVARMNYDVTIRHVGDLIVAVVRV